MENGHDTSSQKSFLEIYFLYIRDFIPHICGRFVISIFKMWLAEMLRSINDIF